MEVTFWGVRGSYPIARPDNVRYGGNSSCLHLRLPSGEEWIIDGGSGLHPLGREMMAREFGRGEGFARILISHTHWDHILGFPFFAPAYVPGNRFEIYSAGQEGARIDTILAGQHRSDGFPVPLDALQAELSFHDLPQHGEVVLGSTAVTTIQLNHPGMTLGFAIETPGPARAKLVVYTDTARIHAVRLGDGMEDLDPDRFDAALVEHAAGADLLVHDAQFTEEGIVGKEHWGHSTPRDAVDLAREAGARSVALFHHAPEHSDTQVDAMVRAAVEAAGGDVDVFGASEETCRTLGRADT